MHLKKAVFLKLFVMPSSVGIVSIEVETKSKILNIKFQMSTKRENVSQSGVCVLANQKNAKVSHSLVGQLDLNLSHLNLNRLRV